MPYVTKLFAVWKFALGRIVILTVLWLAALPVSIFLLKKGYVTYEKTD